mgnify:CR=1 FL=1
MESKLRSFFMDSNYVLMDGFEPTMSQVDSNISPADEYKVNRVEPGGVETDGFDSYGCELEVMFSTCSDDILSVRPRIDLIFGTLTFTALLDVSCQL